MFHPGYVIGPYSLVRTLGRGAFGEVWLAEKRSSLLTTMAALKMPLVTENEVETVRQEAELWLRASGHPNIVPVLDAEVYDGQVVIASEYVAGGNLHEWMEAYGGKAPSLEEAVATTSGILAGLDYLHRAGLIHRDLKPENVLLQDGIARLTDFGLARVLKTEAQSGTVSGTPRYMAPETFSGFYSASADLWAIGVMLQELLTGAHPFPTQEMMALIIAIQGQEPTPLPNTIPDRLRSIVTRLLAKSPSDRYASASAVREALQSSLHSMVSVRLAIRDSPALPNHNLPIQPTSFVGREKQILELKGMLELTHLLTLTGSGGCGKTRLSLQLAEAVLERFTDGVWLVELASLADPSLVPQAIADVLDIREAPGEPVTTTLATALKDKSLLLVLDNCEHVLEVTARLADTILHSCPNVRLLVSSREALGIAGEGAYRVPSLSLPDRKQPQGSVSVSGYESVRLFVARAIAVKSDFVVTDSNAPLLASICYRLDGIPLAIELAAARTRSLSVEEINSKLDNRFHLLTGGGRTALPRHKTLLSMIQWSYDLLNSREKSLLCRLSVFAGGWTLEAVEAVGIGGDVEDWEVLDLLTSLVDKSLVVPEVGEERSRYRLLETIRQYARDRLVDSGAGETVRELHQAFYLAIAEEAEPKLTGPKQTVWLDRLEQEHDNLRAALTWGNREIALRIAGALWRFWDIRGYFSEGLKWLTDVLENTDATARTLARAKALFGAGVLNSSRGDFTAAQTLCKECLEIYQELGDLMGVAASLNILGTIASDQGDYAAARRLHEDSLAKQRELGNQQGIAASLNNLGNIARHQGDYTSARKLQEQCLAIQRELGNRQGIAYALHGLGNVAYFQDEYALARTLFEESLAIRRELGDKQGIATSLNNLAMMSHNQDGAAVARKLYEESLAVLRELGDKKGIAYLLINLGQVAHLRGELVSTRMFYEESLTILREMGNKPGIAYALEAFAGLAVAQRQPERATRLWSAAEALREEVGSTQPLSSRTQYDRQVSDFRASLSEESFDAAWAEGRAVTMDKAIEYALEEIAAQ